MEGPQTEQVAVVGIDCPKQGQELCAFIVLKQGFTLDQVKDYCFQNMQNVKIPARWLVVSELPRNSMLKVDKTIIRNSF